jgi:glycosyltransferase involved in cell wall biosynthesis
VAVIVPAGPGSVELPQCLDALGRCVPPPNEIIVVVDGAGDETVEVARRFGAEVVVEPRPTGPAAARNRGSRRARSEILLFVDADVEVQPDLVGRVALMLSGDGEPSAVFGSYDDDPAAPGVVSRYRNLLHHWVHQHGREQASTFWSGCGAIRRTIFEAVGGFPAVPTIEDIVLGSRLRADGHTIRLDPTLQVKHLKRWTMVNLVWTDLAKRAVPWTELMLRRHRLLNELNVDATGRVSVALMGVVVVALLLSIVSPAVGLAAAAAGAALLAVNFRFYRFLAGLDGWWFALRAIPLHWLYFLCCGIGFVIGSARAWMLPDRDEVRSDDTARAA